MGDSAGKGRLSDGTDKFAFVYKLTISMSVYTFKKQNFLHCNDSQME